jgi:hypothetical protein
LDGSFLTVRSLFSCGWSMLAFPFYWSMRDYWFSYPIQVLALSEENYTTDTLPPPTQIFKEHAHLLNTEASFDSRKARNLTLPMQLFGIFLIHRLPLKSPTYPFVATRPSFRCRPCQTNQSTEKEIIGIYALHLSPSFLLISREAEDTEYDSFGLTPTLPIHV